MMLENRLRRRSSSSHPWMWGGGLLGVQGEKKLREEGVKLCCKQLVSFKSCLHLC